MTFSIIITIVTIISLFADDIRQIFFPKEADIVFSIITIICMLMFLFEMVCLSLVKENYFNGYYFWLDMISTLTMVLDLMWITELISGGSGVQSTASVAKVARASRASKIGAKATKLIRIIRLIRILKLYKTAAKKLEKETRGNYNKGPAIVVNEQASIKYSSNRHFSKKGSIDERYVSKRWTRLRQATLK